MIDDKEQPWGILAGEAIAAPLPDKWDRETTKWRLKDHCVALVQEGNSREDTLRYLLEYNRAGAEDPKWFAGSLPGLVQLYEDVFAAHDREEQLIVRCSPVDWVCSSGAEIVAQKMDPRRVLVSENGKPVFYAKSINQIFSWRGLGKSLFALGLSNLMAGGGKMLRYACEEPSEVLYVDGELPKEQAQERLREFVTEDNLKHVHQISPDLLDMHTSINLFNPEHAQAIRRMVEEQWFWTVRQC